MTVCDGSVTVGVDLEAGLPPLYADPVLLLQVVLNVLNNALVNITTAFTGTTAFSIQVGTTTTTNSLVTAQSVLTAGVLAGVPTTATIRTATATANLVAIFTNATGGSPSALTAGELDIYLNIVDLSQPDRLG